MQQMQRIERLCAIESLLLVEPIPDSRPALHLQPESGSWRSALCIA